MYLKWLIWVLCDLCAIFKTLHRAQLLPRLFLIRLSENTAKPLCSLTVPAQQRLRLSGQHARQSPEHMSLTSIKIIPLVTSLVLQQHTVVRSTMQTIQSLHSLWHMEYEKP